MTGTASPNSLTVSNMSGSLHGGIQAIVGAHVYLYAANLTGGYGSVATSLMTLGSPGTTTDGSSHAYVTTDSHGSFGYGGTFTCPAPTSQIYLLAIGGNPGGSGGVNGAIALSAALGDCSSINSSTFTNMSEVTTVAMAYALNAFMTDPTHVGTTTTNVAGLKAAFVTANNLFKSTTGTARTTTPGGNGTVPQRNLNTLANILAACVNSGSSSNTNCTSLFSNTAVPTTPTDTLTAALHIAALPGASVTNLYALSAPVSSFQPALSTQPNDFSVGITFSPAIPAIQPAIVVIDASGNIWMANCKSCLLPTAPDSLLEFSSTGTLLHEYTGSAVPTTQVLHKIKGIALDATSTYIYTINQGVAGGLIPGTGDDQIVKMSTASGTVQSGFPLDFDQATYGVDTFNGITIDNFGEIWATATNAGAVVEVTPSGFLINGSPFFVGGTAGAATDSSGHIWFAGVGGNNLIEFDTDGDFLNNGTPTGLNQPLSVAIDSSNDLWVINAGTSSLSRIDPSNPANITNASGSPYTGLGLHGVAITAVDGTNQVLIPNCRIGCVTSGSTAPDGVVRVNNSGVLNDGATGDAATMQVSGLSGPVGVAVDAAGNAWIANNVSGTLTQVVGFAAPTRQPLAAAALAGKIGQLP